MICAPSPEAVAAQVHCAEEVRHICRRTVSPEEMVAIVREKSRHTIGLGLTAEDEVLPVLLLDMDNVLGMRPVKDILYCRVATVEQPKPHLLVYTDRGTVSVYRNGQSTGVVFSECNYLKDDDLYNARSQAVEMFFRNGSIPVSDFRRKRVTLIGDIARVNYFTLAALEYLLQLRGARGVEFIGLKP